MDWKWQHPGWLYLILPMAAGWLLLSLYSRRRRQRAADAFVAQAMRSRILPADSRARFWFKLLFREAAIVTGLAALAGPQFGNQYEEVVPRGSDLYVLIDVSRSMLAQDVPPSRLGRAKADVAALLNRLEGERVGLIAFAGQAVVKCPLTVDYDAFRRSLDELDPASAPRGGTAIGDAIRKALEVFHAKTERDQAILLITDGDDQQSYPLEAAATAAERHVTIFTVGLGDATQGARIPQGAASKSYVEYEGQQVWSKLDGTLLKDIALKTSGVYVPVGTRAYDLGELYTHHLHGRSGDDTESRTRIRRAERFQIFLALSLLALLADLFTRPYSVVKTSGPQGFEQPRGAVRGRTKAKIHQAQLPSVGAVVLCVLLTGISRADNPDAAVRDGMRLYRADDFEKAREKFAQAREEFGRSDAGKSAIAAFDEACASHRKGDVAHARECYLQAGLAHDKSLAAAAHFNLGTLASEEARKLAGEHPETVAPEKRQEIVDQLKAAVASFRHSLELQPENTRARRDIELVRQWIKYYGDKWQAYDREKRRQEMNLVAFLEFLIETQRALRESVKALPGTATADSFAELKRVQDELQEEILPLKEKIKTELRPAQGAAGAVAQGGSQELEKGLALLQGWADAAGEKMHSAGSKLLSRLVEGAATDQQSAIDEMERIWDAVIPFHPLLARDLADQTQIAGALHAETAPESKVGDEKASEKKAPDREKNVSKSANAQAGGGHPVLANDDEDLARLAETQDRTQRRTQLLKLKAEAELARLKEQPAAVAPKEADKPSAGKDSSKNAPDEKAKPVDPEKIKAGYQKASWRPKATWRTRMERAENAKLKDRPAAYPPAEEARKILEEIQKAQPPEEQQKQDQKDQDKRKDEQQKQDQKDQKDEQKKQDQKDQDKKKDEQKKQDQKDQDKKKDEQQKKDQDKKKDEQQKKDQEKKKPEDQNSSGEEKQDRKQQMSQDQIEDALRKVRERQQEKRERDRNMKARVIGRAPVEKDW